MRKQSLFGITTAVAALAGGPLLAGPASTASSGAATVQLSSAYETVQAAAATIDARVSIYVWSDLCPLRSYSSGMLLMLR